jgi:hypothetical protein
MAITDYSTLQSTISRWVGGSSDTQFAESIRDAIMLAEDEMNATLRVPEMIKRASTTIDEKYENLPPDCLELINVWRVADDYEVPLGYQPTSNIVAAGRLSGLPRWYTLSGLQIRLAPLVTGESYVIRLTYYASLPNLSDANACTAVLTRYPLLYLYLSLAHMQGYLVGDERIGTWKQQAGAHLQMANRAAGRRMSSHAA